MVGRIGAVQAELSWRDLATMAGLKPPDNAPQCPGKRRGGQWQLKFPLFSANEASRCCCEEPGADFPQRWRRKRGGEKRPMGRRRVKIVTAGCSSHPEHGPSIRARPRSNKWRRSPKPMCCLSADNGDQFWGWEKNWPKRNVGRGWFWPGTKELPAAAGGKEVGKGGCAGWDSCIDRAIFVRPSLTEPPEILNLLLLLFSSFSARLLFLLLFLKLEPGEKWRRVCRLIDPSPPATSTQ